MSINEWLACEPVGFNGLLNDSTGMGGSPVVLFLANQGVDKQTFCANLVTCFSVLMPEYVAGSILNGHVVAQGLLRAGVGPGYLQRTAPRQPSQREHLPAFCHLRMACSGNMGCLYCSARIETLDALSESQDCFLTSAWASQ